MMADPAEGLEPDITEITDLKEREAQQLEYYGGDPLDDDEDLSKADRGDMLESETASEDRGDEVTETQEEEKVEATDVEDDEATDAATEGTDEPDAEVEEETVDSGDEEDPDAATDEDNVVETEQKDPGIPRHRFNEVNERMKKAEQRLAELEAQRTAETEATEDKYDFDTAEKDYVDLLLDGKTEEAAAKRSEIRAAEQAVFTANARQETISDVNEQAELRDLNELSVQAEEAYPIFNENSETYDPTIANKVVVYMKGYMSEGQSISDAFVSGLADVIEQYDLDGTRAAAREQSNQATEPTETKGKPIKKTAEKVQVAKQAVKSPAGQGEGSAERGISTPSITDMSDADLDKLTEEQLARMRGDYIE